MTITPEAIARVMSETGMAEMQAYRHLQARQVIRERAGRKSPDSVWPLRDASGQPWSARK